MTHVYLVAVLDLYSRKVLSWRISNTMEASFCVAALEEALAKWGTPAIFNTDQGSQFTSDAFVKVLKEHGIAITLYELKAGIHKYFSFYNSERYHQSLEYSTPDEMYDSRFQQGMKAGNHAA